MNTIQNSEKNDNEQTNEELLIKKLKEYSLIYIKIDDPKILLDVYNLFLNDQSTENDDPIYLFYYGSYQRFIKKNYDLAEEYYLKAIQKNNNIYAIVSLAKLYQKQKKYDLAKEYYLKALDLEPVIEKQSHLYYHLATLYNFTEKYDLAKTYFLLAIDSNDDDVDSMNFLALIYEKEKEYDLAKKYYLMAIDKKYVYSMNNLAMLYDDSKEYELAEKYFLMAIEQEHVESMINLAHLYTRLEKYDSAEKYYLMAIDHNEVSAIYRLGHLYQLQGEYDLAESNYLRSLEIIEDTHVLNYLANLYVHLCKYQEAEQYYYRAIELGDVSANHNLATMYQEMGEDQLSAEYMIIYHEQTNNNEKEKIEKQND